MFGELLRDLIAHTGAEYCCVADAAAGKVLEEAGAQGGTDTSLAVLGWGAGAESFLAVSSGEELDDLIVTTRTSYHLVRRLGEGPNGALLIYVRVDRRRGNLALARRGLATTGSPSAAAPVPAQRGGPGPMPAPAPAPGPAAVLAAAPTSALMPTRMPAAVVALPRRQPVALPAPRRPSPTVRVPDGSATGAGVPGGGRWHTDASTLDRLLQALRRLP